MTTATMVKCDACCDEGSCPEHTGALVFCGRCAGTGKFVTYVENGVPKGPGGPCFRCNGKGAHTHYDRKRNAAHTRYAIDRL